jgi:hypothetical protein
MWDWGNGRLMLCAIAEYDGLGWGTDGGSEVTLDYLQSSCIMHKTQNAVTT